MTSNHLVLPQRPGSSLIRRGGLRAALGTLLLALVAGLLVAVAAPASAAPLGSLTFTPLTGTDLSRSTIKTVSAGTPKGCPADTGYIGSSIVQLSRVDGVTPSGLWASGISGFNVKSSGFSTSSEFSVQLADTWKGLAAANGIPLVAGRYEVTLNCLDQFAAAVLGSFSGSLWFTTATAFQWWNPSGAIVTPTVTVSPANSANASSPVSLTASLSPAAAGGSVQFRDTINAVTANVGSAVAVSGGQAVLANVTTLALGPHSFSAVFTPSDPASYQPATSANVAFTVVAAGAPTTTVLQVSPALTAALNDPVTITATVSPAAATGSVQFRTTLNGVTTDLGAAQPVSGGTSTLASFTGLKWGVQTLSAQFTSSDTTLYLGSSSSAVPYTITGVQPTTTTLSGPTGKVAPGSAISLSSVVSPPGAAGKVAFVDTFGGADMTLGTVDVAAGVASLSPTLAGIGTHSIVATFQPTDSTQYATSTSTAVVVDVGPLDTTVSLQTSAGGSVVPGGSFTLTAALTPSTAAGRVTFSDTYGGVGSDLATVDVASGQAALTTSLSSVGSHSLRATFVPNDTTQFVGSTSSVVSLVVAVPQVSLGNLTFSPATGKDSTRSIVTTVSSGATKGCPAAASFFSATVSGPGGWAAGVIGKGATPIPTASKDFTFNMANSWVGIADFNSITIVPGKYTVRVTCRDDTGAVEFGYFEGSIWFVDATNFQDKDPASSARTTEVALADSPTGYNELGSPLTLTATVSPADATGTVQFVVSSNGTAAPLGSPALVVGGTATLTLSTLEFGLYDFSAAFTSDKPNKYLPSSSSVVTHAVRLIVPPVPTALPSLGGSAVQGGSLVCNVGTWSNNPTGFSYIWLRNGIVIPDASGPTYRPLAADASRSIRCRVSASNAGGTVYRDTSSVVIPLVAAPRLLKSPVYSGVFKVRSIVKVTVGLWRPTKVVATFQWYVNGKAIRGATKSSYKIPSSLKKKYLNVRITARFSGSKTATVFTKRVRVA